MSTQSKPQDSILGTILTYAIAGVLSAMFLSVAFIVTKITWPAVKYICTFMWRTLRGIKMPKRTPKEPKVVRQLHTPACFEGCDNLAPAKQFRI